MKSRLSKRSPLSLSLLPENLQDEVRSIQKKAQTNYKSNPSIQRYSAYFMISLHENQREQVIKYLYETPLYRELTFVIPLQQRKRWLFIYCRHNNHPTNREFFLVERRLVLSDQRLVLAEQGKTFVVRTINPQP